METVIGVFPARDDADRAIRALDNLGYKSEDMSIIVKDGDIEHRVGSQDNVTDNVASGAVAGGAIGGLAGLLIGVGALAIPGVGAFLIAGPIAAALGLTGAAATTISGAVTGALAGGLVGAIATLGLPEREARYYEERVREGAVLLAVSVSNEQNSGEVEDLFRENRADQVRTLAQMNA
ncbi:MAG TPA: general stress protein [Candidatus Saccharimonadales bacterium]|nr:general stress protein [Candidatus Saccharimonadales bacterium]